jgi:hypothetical protein
LIELQNRMNEALTLFVTGDSKELPLLFFKSTRELKFEIILIVPSTITSVLKSLTLLPAMRTWSSDSSYILTLITVPMVLQSNPDCTRW